MEFNQAQNEQSNDEETMLRDFIRQEIGEYNQQGALASTGWDSFRKQSEYIQLLVQIQGADHNVHKELDEAIAKIKEITYA